MSFAHITKITPKGEDGPKLVLSLIGAPDDVDEHSEEHQRDLRRVEQGLRDAGVQVAPRGLARKGADFGFQLSGEFMVLVTTLGVPALTFLGAWVQARFGRKVRIKVGEVEVEASTPKEVEHLLEKAKAFRAEDAAKS